MVIIGELINGTYKDVNRAISNREGDLIEHLAIDQIKAGASILDVNVGPYSKDPVKDMVWLVDEIQKAADVGLSLDSTKLDAIEACLAKAKRKALINSTTADDDKMDGVFKLARRYGSAVIGIATDRSGIPNDVSKRVELAAKIVARALDAGITPEDLYIDPIAYPVNIGQAQSPVVLDAIKEFASISDPAVKTVIGLSNVGQGARQRRLLKRTYLSMAVAYGLSAVIMDPLDNDLMDTLIAAEVLMNKSIYCDSFLEAYRKR